MPCCFSCVKVNISTTPANQEDGVGAVSVVFTFNKRGLSLVNATFRRSANQDISQQCSPGEIQVGFTSTVVNSGQTTVITLTPTEALPQTAVRFFAAVTAEIKGCKYSKSICFRTAT